MWSWTPLARVVAFTARCLPEARSRIPCEVMSAHTTETPAATSAHDPPNQPPPRIVSQYPSRSVGGGRYPAKRCVGDRVAVQADVFRDGHELIRTTVRYRAAGESQWREAEMHRIDAHLDGVRWAGEFEVDRPGLWQYT